MDRSASDYTQPDQASAATAAAAVAASPSAPTATAAPAGNQQSPNTYATSQPEARPSGQYTAPADSRQNNNNTANPTNIPTTNTPQPDYGLNQPAAHPPPAAQRAAAPYPDYLPRQPQYHPTPNTQAGGAAGMAQATSPSSMLLQDGQQNGHRSAAQIKSDTDIPIDPSIAASSPTYPPPYSPYNPQGHDMSQFPGHPQHPQMYPRPDWHQYGQPQHGLPGPYSSPATTVSSAAPAVTAGPPRPGQTHSFPQVYSFVPIPGSQQHKRPRRRYEEIERMYKCGYNGCEKAYGTLNHLNAHVTMQGHGAKRTPEEFKEIRKEWKARKKEEENQRKALEERERAAAAAQVQAQASQVDASTPADPAQTTQTPSYPAGVRPQLPPIGYQPADGQVPGQYNASPGGTLVYPQGNGQMPTGYPTNYPHSPYNQGNQVYQQPPPDNQSNNYQ